PTKPDQRTTLWKELRELLAFEIANGGQVSIVNRLDRETSGLVLVAKNFRGRAAIRIAYAGASFAQRISGDRFGLAGMGNKNRRRADGSAGQTSAVSDLVEANDSSSRCARADRVSS